MRIRLAIFLVTAGVLAGAAVPVFAARGGTPKVLVCHRGHTIRISSSAVPAHLRHGDTLGACGAATQTSTPAATPTSSAEPTATGTAEPTATGTPEATATSTAEATATSTPEEPTATATEEPTATPTDVIVTGSNTGHGNGHGHGHGNGHNR